MFPELFARAIIVPLVLFAIGAPLNASAHTRIPAPSPSVANVDDATRSPNGVFVIDTIEQARTQLALAQLAISETSASNTRNLAFQAQELWTSVDDRLRKIAQALGIPTKVEQDAKERVELYRLQHMKEADLDSAYVRLVTRSCNDLMERMDRLDPQIDSRLLFFVDDMLPRFGQFQMGLRNRYALTQHNHSYFKGTDVTHSS
jgi:hypothetical protein